MQGGTVSATVDSTTNNGRMVGICSYHTDGYRLGIGTEGIQRHRGIGTWIIIDVTIYVVVLIFGLIGIGI